MLSFSNYRLKIYC